MKWAAGPMVFAFFLEVNSVANNFNNVRAFLELFDKVIGNQTSHAVSRLKKVTNASIRAVLWSICLSECFFNQFTHFADIGSTLSFRLNVTHYLAHICH